MATEKEKKFVLKYMPKDVYKTILIEQEYLYNDGLTCVRKRKIIADGKEQFLYTVKTKGDCGDHERIEIENVITKDEFLKLHGYGIISKERKLIKLNNGLTAEIDVFHGKLEGLCYCEIEYQNEDDLKDIPFIGDELDDKELSNAHLSSLDEEDAKIIVEKYLLNYKNF